LNLTTPESIPVGFEVRWNEPDFTPGILSTQIRVVKTRPFLRS